MLVYVMDYGACKPIPPAQSDLVEPDSIRRYGSSPPVNHASRDNDALPFWPNLNTAGGLCNAFIVYCVSDHRHRRYYITMTAQ